MRSQPIKQLAGIMLHQQRRQVLGAQEPLVDRMLEESEQGLPVLDDVE